jgi:hypothetical protein
MWSAQDAARKEKEEADAANEQLVVKEGEAAEA